VESILETYFGFGSLTLAIEALGGFQLVMQSLGLLSAKGKTIEKFEKGKERKLNAAELEMVNEHFKKEFGKVIDSTVTMNAGNVNAFTLKKDIFSNVKHQLNVDTVNITDGKISWKEEIKPATYIGTNLSLFTLPNVTGGQVLSVILHEIGHCFYQGSIISRCISTIFSAMLTIPMIIMKIINKVESLTFSVIGKSTILTEIVNIVYGSVLSFLNIYCSFMNLNLTEVWSRIFPNSDKQTPQALMNALKLSKTVHILYKMIIATAESGSETVSTIFRAFANPMVVLKIIGGDVLTEEKYCDNFAAAHGYGPDLSQALTTVGGGVLFDKTHDSEKDKLSKIQRTSLVLGYLNVLLSEIQHLADEHPNLTSRPLFIADYYKEELKKTNDPKTKAYIEKLIVDSLKATTQYRLANKKLKDDMKRIALDTNDNTGIFDKFNSSAFDRLKNAVSIDTGSLNNLQTRIGHSTGAN
jgi:Zn-dependent protease with chaperone function